MISVEKLREMFSKTKVESLKTICIESGLVNLLIVPPQGLDSPFIDMVYFTKNEKLDLDGEQIYQITSRMENVLGEDILSLCSYYHLIDGAARVTDSEAQETIQRLQSGIPIQELNTNKTLETQWREHYQLFQDRLNKKDVSSQPQKSATYSPRFAMSSAPSAESLSAKNPEESINLNERMSHLVVGGR